jgi:hypothetical protein
VAKVTATALFMQESIPAILDGVESPIDERKITYVYEADDGTGLVVNALTRYEAYLLEREWFGEETARENYHRMDD